MPKKTKWYEKEIKSEYVLPLISFSVLFLYMLIISKIPHFLTQIYNVPLKKDLPFSAEVEKKLPLSPTVIGAVFLGLFSVYFFYAPIDFYSGTFFALMILLDVSMTSSITVTSSASLQSLFVLLSLTFSHHVLYYTPFNIQWFISVIFSWVFLYLALLFNLDCVGILISLHIQFFIYSFVEAFYFKYRKVRNASIGKKLFCLFYVFLFLFVPSVIMSFVDVYIYKNVIQTPFRFEYLNLQLLKDEISKNESVSFLLIILISFTAPIFLDFHHDMLIPFFAMLIGAAITLFVPIQTNGDTIPRKIHFCKIQLFLAIGLIVGSLKNEWYSRGIVAVLVIISFISKLIWLKSEAVSAHQIPSYVFNNNI